MLFGRDEELDRIDEALGEARLVTLTGPGGVGKSALALAVAESSPVHALIVELTSLGPSDLAESIAGSLGFVSFPELTQHLADGGTLLVVDNCEHILDAAADFVERLLSDCPDLSILATSRERLGLDSETVIPVQPLRFEGADSPAVAMFTDVAVRSGSMDLDPATVGSLVGRLDGLPLAIELAAARSSSIDPAVMLEHLDARIDLISRSRRRGLNRHRSLEAAIAWSHQLLDERQRHIFERLGVLPGRFDPDLAAAAAGIDVVDMFDPLTGLVERSLLVHEPAHGVSWYRMLETIRLFARDRVETAGETQTVEARVLAHLGRWADDWVAMGMRVDGAKLRRLDSMFRNLAWAVDRCLGSGDEETCHRLVAPLWWLEDVGHQGEGADLLERVIAQWPPMPSGGPLDSERARTAGIAASLHRIAGRLQRAARIARSVVDVDDGQGAAYAHRVLGHLARSRGDWNAAFQHLGAGAAAATGQGHPGLAMEIRMHEAMTHARSGDPDRAIAILEELRDASDSYRQLHSWVSLFLAWLLLFRDPVRTEAIAREIAETAGSSGDLWSEATSGVDLAAVILARDGDHREAAALLADSLRRYHQIGNRTDIRLCYLLGAAVAAADNEESAAQRLVATAMHHYTQAVLGEVEADFLAEHGVPLEVDPSTPRVSVEEAVALLERVAVGEPEPPTDTGTGWFRPDVDVWDVGYRGRGAKVAHSKGMTDIARLLARPAVELAALDLMDAGLVEQGSAVADARARAAYKNRIVELREEIDHTSALGDDEAAARAQDELDALVVRLSADYGIGGRERQTGSTAEKARTAVTWRIRSAIKRIAESHPDLAAHLDRSVRTGRFCSYQPETPVEWSL